ncbi:hypothetical protein [Parasphingorhabdus sp.]|uniref:hypothetical protein n=1 Tax=Parasphingorhabdus sp. TaxID=2709688 RepID=UPI0032655607
MAEQDFSNDRGANQSLLQRATHAAGTSAFAADDLAAALFPKSDVRFSDRMLSFSRQYLKSLVFKIEKQLCLVATQRFDVADETIAAVAASDQGHSLPLLEQAGIINSSEILGHVFVQAQKAELSLRLVQKISQAELERILTRHLDHADPAIAEAAMGLLVAQSREGGNSDNSNAPISGLPAEIMHALVWPITAAVAKLAGSTGSELVAAAESVLSEHDESDSAQSRADRLARLIDGSADSAAQNLHPLRDGLELFVARLSLRTHLPASQIYAFTADRNMARLVVLLKSMNLPAEEALSIHASLDGNGESMTAASYHEIDIHLASRLVSTWSANRDYQAAVRMLDAQDAGALRR